MDINCSPNELDILKKISIAANDLGVPCFIIGGFVRDKLLNRSTKDLDIVCVGDGLELATRAAQNFRPVPKISFFKNYGTAHFKSGDGFDVEFVGARKESYAQTSRNPEVLPGSIIDDQNRRDFTINALAVSLNEENFGQLIDPFDGIKDLQSKIIKTPLDPDQTFSDDPLRMMRAVRFATQLGFAISAETFSAIEKNKARLAIVSQERITDELNMIIMSAKPSSGFKILFESGLLNQFFSKMADLAGAQFVEGKGHKDNFYHTLQVLDNVADRSDNLWLRWAAILHDIGKPATKAFEPGHGWTFHGHEVVGGRMVVKIFNQLKLPLSDNVKYVKKLVELHLRPISLTKENISDSAVRRLLFDAGNDFDDLMILCESDITSKNRLKVKRYLENFEAVKRKCEEVEEQDAMRNWQPPISGELIMEIFSLQPSKQVGIIKDAIRNAILDGEIANNYEAAYKFMLEKGVEYNLKPLK
jgi:putative nucleotidyltransferase with HDIG domain